MPGGRTGWRKPCTRILLFGPPLSLRSSVLLTFGSTSFVGPSERSMPSRVITDEIAPTLRKHLRTKQHGTGVNTDESSLVPLLDESTSAPPRVLSGAGDVCDRVQHFDHNRAPLRKRTQAKEHCPAMHRRLEGHQRDHSAIASYEVGRLSKVALPIFENANKAKSQRKAGPNDQSCRKEHGYNGDTLRDRQSGHSLSQRFTREPEQQPNP